MQLRACSRLVRTETGSPKELYTRNKHLGIFTWPQVLRVAGGTLDKSIMALHFEDTESFRKPIHWNAFRPLLVEAGLSSVETRLMKPTKIPGGVFLKLYERANR